MYNQEYKDTKGVCERCGSALNGQQKRWCSLNCSKLGLKREYKKRYPDKVKEYRRKIRSKNRPMKCSKARKLKEGKCCVRCKSEKKLNVHHVVPRRFGGTNDPNNVIILCWRCHMDIEKRMKGYWFSN